MTGTDRHHPHDDKRAASTADSTAEPTKLTAAQAAALPMLAGAGLLVGTWALLPRYVSPRIELGARADQLEFVDHVLPGAAVIVISLLALLVGRGPAAANRLFAAGLGIVAAGLWMDATHFPLVRQAFRDEAPWGATLHHSIPGVAVLLLGVGWCLAYRAPGTRSRPADDAA